MGKDLGNDHGIFEGGDALQSTASPRALFDVEIECAFEQARPTHARWHFRARSPWNTGTPSLH